MSINKLVVITSPFSKTGGVYTFVSNILPFFKHNVYLFFRGKNPKIKNIIIQRISTLLNPILFIYKIISLRPKFVIINSSLSVQLLVRDGILVFISKLFYKKILLIIHGFEESALNKKWLLYGYFKSDAIVVLSNEFKRRLLDNGYPKNIYTIYNPVSIQLLHYTKDQNNIDKLSSIRNILFMARLEKEKGIYIAIETFNFLQKKYPQLKLHIAGLGSELLNIKKLLAKEKFNNIILYGFVEGEKKIELLKIGDIFLFPSYKEGLPISVLEAMAFGQLIVTRPVGGLKDLYAAHKFGLMLETTSATDFSNAIFDKIQDKNWLMKIRKNNINFAEKHFNTLVVTKQIEDILYSL